MNALNEKLPEIITDEREYKKIKRDLDKTVYDLDQATRLEKQGLTKEAIAEKEKAADRGAHLWQNLASYQSHVKGAELTSEATRFAATESRKGHEATAAATRESTQAYRNSADQTKAYQQTLAAEEAVRRTREGIEREKSSPNSQYAADQKTIANYEGADLDAAAKKRLDAAKKRVEEANTEFETRIKRAEKTAESTSNRYLGLTGDTPHDATTTTTTSTRSVERPSWVPAGAEKAQDGNWYMPNPQKPGEYLRVKPKNN
jgi:tetrahydromethanopterin S-methyltransferase subunit G